MTAPAVALRPQSAICRAGAPCCLAPPRPVRRQEEFAAPARSDRVARGKMTQTAASEPISRSTSAADVSARAGAAGAREAGRAGGRAGHRRSSTSAGVRRMRQQRLLATVMTPTATRPWVGARFRRRARRSRSRSARTCGAWEEHESPSRPRGRRSCATARSTGRVRDRRDDAVRVRGRDREGASAVRAPSSVRPPSPPGCRVDQGRARAAP